MSDKMKLLTEWTPLSYDKSLLKEYKEQHGNCRVPNKYKTSEKFNLA